MSRVHKQERCERDSSSELRIGGVPIRLPKDAANITLNISLNVAGNGEGDGLSIDEGPDIVGNQIRFVRSKTSVSPRCLTAPTTSSSSANEDGVRRCYPCPECRVQLTSRSEFWQHLNSVHGVGFPAEAENSKVEERGRDDGHFLGRGETASKTADRSSSNFVSLNGFNNNLEIVCSNNSLKELKEEIKVESNTATSTNLQVRSHTQEPLPIRASVCQENSNADSDVEIIGEFKGKKSGIKGKNVEGDDVSNGIKSEDISKSNKDTNPADKVKTTSSVAPPVDLVELLESANWLDKAAVKGRLQCRICNAVNNSLGSLAAVNDHMQRLHHINVVQYAALFLLKADNFGAAANCCVRWCGLCKGSGSTVGFVCKTREALEAHLKRSHGQSLAKHAEVFGDCLVKSFVTCPWCQTKLLHERRNIRKHAFKHRVKIASFLKRAKEAILSSLNAGANQEPSKQVRAGSRDLKKPSVKSSQISTRSKVETVQSKPSGTRGGVMSLPALLESANWLNGLLGKGHKSTLLYCQICKFRFDRESLTSIDAHVAAEHSVNAVQYVALFVEKAASNSAAADCCVFFCGFCRSDGGKRRTDFVSRRGAGLAQHLREAHGEAGLSRHTKSFGPCLVKSHVACPWCGVGVLHMEGHVRRHAAEVHKQNTDSFIAAVKEQLLAKGKVVPQPLKGPEKNATMCKEVAKGVEASLIQSIAPPPPSPMKEEAPLVSTGSRRLKKAASSHNSTWVKPEIGGVRGSSSPWHSMCTYECDRCKYNTHVLDLLRHHLKKAHQVSLRDYKDKAKLLIQEHFTRCFTCNEPVLHDYYSIRQHRRNRHREEGNQASSTSSKLPGLTDFQRVFLGYSDKQAMAAAGNDKRASHGRVAVSSSQLRSPAPDKVLVVGNRPRITMFEQ